jgi:hypothetical protein
MGAKKPYEGFFWLKFLVKKVVISCSAKSQTTNSLLSTKLHELIIQCKGTGNTKHKRGKQRDEHQQDDKHQTCDNHEQQHNEQ